MKYYIANFNKKNGADIPSSLMDLNDIIEIYFNYLECVDYRPILCNQNGEEINDVCNELAGYVIKHDSDVLKVSLVNYTTGKYKTYYHVLNLNNYKNKAEMYYDAVAKTKIPEEFEINSVELFVKIRVDS